VGILLGAAVLSPCAVTFETTLCLGHQNRKLRPAIWGAMVNLRQKTLNRACHKRVKTSGNQWMSPCPMMLGSPADFGRLIADDTEKWAKVVKLSGAKPE
jgi:hypothetical protein